MIKITIEGMNNNPDPLVLEDVDKFIAFIYDDNDNIQVIGSSDLSFITHCAFIADELARRVVKKGFALAKD
ncbi:MAG TPA: hypothetical protein PLZ49_09905 [Bacillota bacterium]|nr:hypothetical protein [Bacillota bacterium]